MNKRAAVAATPAPSTIHRIARVSPRRYDMSESDIATNDDFPALEIVAPFDTLTLDVACAEISRDAMLTAAPTPTAQDQQLTDPIGQQAETTCGDLIQNHGLLADWILFLLEREQAAIRLAIKDGLNTECEKKPTAEQVSVSLVTGLFTSESQDYEARLTDEMDNDVLRKNSLAELTDQDASDLIVMLAEIHALSYQKLSMLWGDCFGQNEPPRTSTSPIPPLPAAPQPHPHSRQKNRPSRSPHRYYPFQEECASVYEKVYRRRSSSWKY
jgi:hypothetical protein